MARQNSAPDRESSYSTVRQTVAMASSMYAVPQDTLRHNAYRDDKQDISYRTLITLFGILNLINMAFFSCHHNSVSPRQRLSGVESWVCCYNSVVPTTDIAPYDLAVVDPDAQIDVAALQAAGTKVVAYLSLLEVQPSRWFWHDIVGTDAILFEKTVFDGYFADARSQEWQQTVIDLIIPAILKKGFDGIFLDTIDSAEYLEVLKDGKRYPGMQRATAVLIEAIRIKFPDKILIANRGFAMLPDFEPFIDGLLAESVLSVYNADTEKATVRDSAQYSGYLQMMTEFQRSGGLLLTLDYAINSSPLVQKRLIASAKQHGFVPYLSDPALTAVYHTALELMNGN